MPNTKTNLKWINGLHIRTKATKLLKENMHVNLDLKFSNGFSGMTPKAQATNVKK